MLNKINQKISNVDNERVDNNFSIIFALLSQGYQKEGIISPRVVNETKKASLAYLSAY
jgi:hypothetical protein